MADRPTVLVSIGNSDDKLTQEQWSRYWGEADKIIRAGARDVHGAWVSDSVQPWQNAAWAFTAKRSSVDGLNYAQAIRRRLIALADSYGQDSIAWLEGETEFLRPVPLDA